MKRNISRKAKLPSRRSPLNKQFERITAMIRLARHAAFRTVNATIIELYWNIGAHISKKLDSAQWGESVVTELANYLHLTLPDPRGFSDKNLWRMKQFYETYRQNTKLSTLLRELPWSSHLHILSKTKSGEEREFYLRLAIRDHYTVRELEESIDGGLFERTIVHPPKLSTSLREMHPQIESMFRDRYLLDFLHLPEEYSEADLRTAIIRELKRFVLECGRDFTFVGEEYRVQVGMTDRSVDLLFYNRELQCLVAVELKIEAFKPEHLGKLSFYLEALDRKVKKPHEKPSVGIILCKSKDEEVVEYALSRTLSPAAVAEYRTKLPGKRMLQDKLREFFNSSVREIGAAYEGRRA